MIATFPKQTNLGRLIRDAREEAGYVQKWCAAKCEYSERQWQHWEAGTHIPSGRALKAIVRLFPNLKDYV